MPPAEVKEKPGKDVDSLDEAARANWLAQSVSWLEAYLDEVGDALDHRGESARSRVRGALLEVRRSPDLARLRDTKHLAGLSKDDQHACIMIWVELKKLLVECGE